MAQLFVAFLAKDMTRKAHLFIRAREKKRAQGLTLIVISLLLTITA